MTGIEKSLQLSAANHYTMFFIYPSSVQQTIIAQKGRGFVLSLCCSRKKNPPPERQTAAASPRFPVFRRYTAGRGQPALRKHPEESRPFTEKNNQINRSIQKRHARQRAFSRSTRKAHGIPFPAAFRRSRNRQGQVCRSRPHKIPHKSQGVYLTFIPLPRDACPEPRPPCGREGDIRDSFLGNCPGI